MATWKVPKITTAQRIILIPSASEIMYDTDEKKYYGGDGTTVGGIGISGVDEILWTDIDFTDSTIANIETRNSSDIDYIDANWQLQTSTGNVEAALAELSNQVETIAGTGRVSPINSIQITGLNEITIPAGTGYINYVGFHKKISWSLATIDTSGYSTPGSYFVYVDSNGTLNVATTMPNQNENIILGFFYWTGQQLGMCQDFSYVVESGMTRFLDYISRMGSFIYDNGGQVQEDTTDLQIVSSACKAQYGSMDVSLTECDSADAGTRFFIWFNTANFGWFPDYWALGMNGGKVPINDWNDMAKNIFPTSANGTFTQMSTTVTFTGDLTVELSKRNRIVLYADGWQFITPIASTSFGGGNTTVTLATPYYGTGGTGVTYCIAATSEIEDDKYVKHLILRTLDNNMHLVMGQTQFDSKDDAIEAGLPSIPTAIENSNVKMAYAVVSNATTSLEIDSSLSDIRPLPFTYRIGGTQGGGAITSHSALTDLGNDDHGQYARTDGTRNLTGIQSYNSHPTFTTDTAIIDKKYVDDGLDSIVQEERFTFVLHVGEDATIGTNKTNALIVPSAMTITKVYAYAKTAPIGANLIFDINVDNTSIWDSNQVNRISIASGSNSGIQTSFDNISLIEGNILTIDIDQIGSITAGSDITVIMKCIK